jgi:hypothetical protein
MSGVGREPPGARLPEWLPPASKRASLSATALSAPGPQQAGTPNHAASRLQPEAEPKPRSRRRVATARRHKNIAVGAGHDRAD